VFYEALHSGVCATVRRVKLKRKVVLMFLEKELTAVAYLKVAGVGGWDDDDDWEVNCIDVGSLCSPTDLWCRETNRSAQDCSAVYNFDVGWTHVSETLPSLTGTLCDVGQTRSACRMAAGREQLRETCLDVILPTKKWTALGWKPGVTSDCPLWRPCTAAAGHQEYRHWNNARDFSLSTNECTYNFT